MNWDIIETEVNAELVTLRHEIVALRLMRFAMKADIIKAANAAKSYREYRKKIAAGESPVKLDLVGSVYMRHLYLAYAWVRNKPFAVTESKAKGTVNAYWGWGSPIGNKQYSSTPSAKAIIDIIRHYANVDKSVTNA